MEKVCSICLMGNPDYNTECSHSFHEGCLRKWLKKNETCPYCREDISKGTSFRGPMNGTFRAQQVPRRRFRCRPKFWVILLGLIVLLVTLGGILIMIANRAYTENTFVFEENCMDIPKYAEAYYINKDTLLVTGLNNFEDCKYIDRYHYGCPMAYSKFKEYLSECRVTNTDKFEQRNIRNDLKLPEFLFGIFFITIGTLTVCLLIVIASCNLRF